MIEHGRGILVATICNTIPAAGSYALWVSDGTRQYVADLSDHTAGAAGLTGIARHGGHLYVAVQGGQPRILVLDQTLTVVRAIADPRFADLHSLHIADGGLFIASAANGLVFRYDIVSGGTEVLADFGRPPWVAGVFVTNGDIWVCAHNMAFIDPSAAEGGVYNVTKACTILDGLGKPHTLMAWRDQYLVLDSARSEAVFFDPAGVRSRVALGGWLRGAAAASDETLLIAGGPHRLVSRKRPAGVVDQGVRDVANDRLRIFALTDRQLTRTYIPEMPGFEVYDLLMLPDTVRLTPRAERIVAVERGMFARLYYAALIKVLSGETG